MPRVEEKRRGVRLNSRVPVTVSWENTDGGSNSREAFTRTVGPYGCLTVIPENLSVEQKVSVLNRVTGRSNLGIVVWKSKERAEGWEVGIELTSPPMDFWGLEL